MISGNFILDSCFALRQNEIEIILHTSGNREDFIGEYSHSEGLR